MQLSSAWADPKIAEVFVLLGHVGPAPFDSSAAPDMNMCVHQGPHEIKVYAFKAAPVPGHDLELALALDQATVQLNELVSFVDVDQGALFLPAPTAHFESVFCVRIPREAVQPEQAGSDENQYATAAMDCAVGAIHRTLHAYLIGTEDPRVTYDGLKKFGQVARMLFVNTQLQVKGTKPFMLWHKPPFNLAEDYTRRIDDGIATEVTEHPIDQVVLWRLRANRAYQIDRDDTAALIFLNTSLEMMVGGIYRAMLRDDQLAERARVRAGIDQFRPRLQEIGQKLRGGPWNLDNASSVVGKYWEYLYALRGRVVHGGYRPSGVETVRAFSAGSALRDEIERRVIDARHWFPITCLLLNSRQSLEDRKLYTRRLREAHERLVSEEDPRRWFVPRER